MNETCHGCNIKLRDGQAVQFQVNGDWTRFCSDCVREMEKPGQAVAWGVCMGLIVLIVSYVLIAQ